MTFQGDVVTQRETNVLSDLVPSQDTAGVAGVIVATFMSANKGRIREQGRLAHIHHYTTAGPEGP